MSTNHDYPFAGLKVPKLDEANAAKALGPEFDKITSRWPTNRNGRWSYILHNERQGRLMARLQLMIEGFDYANLDGQLVDVRQVEAIWDRVEQSPEVINAHGRHATKTTTIGGSGIISCLEADGFLEPIFNVSQGQNKTRWWIVHLDKFHAYGNGDDVDPEDAAQAREDKINRILDHLDPAATLNYVELPPTVPLILEAIEEGKLNRRDLFTIIGAAQAELAKPVVLEHHGEMVFE